MTLLQMFWLQKQKDITFDFSLPGRILLWVFLNVPAAEVKAEPSKLELVVLTHHHVSTGSWACFLAWGKEVPSQSLLNFPALDQLRNLIHITLLDCTMPCKTAGMQGDVCRYGLYGLAAWLNQLFLQIFLAVSKYAWIGGTSYIVLK